MGTVTDLTDRHDELALPVAGRAVHGRVPQLGAAWVDPPATLGTGEAGAVPGQAARSHFLSMVHARPALGAQTRHLKLANCQIHSSDRHSSLTKLIILHQYIAIAMQC